MGRLCGAVAYCLGVNVVHADIRRPNLLMDANDNLRLCDPGSARPVGKPLAAATEPFGHVLGPDAADAAQGQSGTCGTAGAARTECFAMGSIFYTLLRGHQPHQNKGWDMPTLIAQLREKNFPSLDDTSPDDNVIYKCGNGHYESVEEPGGEFRKKNQRGGDWYQFERGAESSLEALRQECVEWVASSGIGCHRRGRPMA